MQVGQGVGEKLLEGIAFVNVDTLAFAAVFAKGIIFASLAFFVYLHAFFDKLRGDRMF